MSLSQLEQLIEAGDTLAIDHLLHNNPSLSQEQTSHDISPLLLACYYKKPQIIKVILKHLKTPSLFEACAANQLDVVKIWIEQHPQEIDTYASHGFTPLGIATYFGYEEIVRYLLLKGADPNLPSNNGYQVYPLHSAIGSNFEGIAKMLVEAGAEVNVLQASNITPLHSAAQNGNIEMLILLLEQGAQVNIRTEHGETPADMAKARGHAEIAKILQP